MSGGGNRRAQRQRYRKKYPEKRKAEKARYRATHRKQISRYQRLCRRRNWPWWKKDLYPVNVDARGLPRRQMA